MRIGPFVLVGSVFLAAALAALYPDSAPPASARTKQQPLPADPIAMTPPEGNELPPNHPAIGGGSGGAAGSIGPSNDETVGMTWKMPSAWKVAPSPNTMRIATYRVPATSGDEDAEVSVSRAGGTVDANIERWAAQFDTAGKEVRAVRTVRGLKVTIVEIHGTFQGSGMAATAPAPRAGWAMLAAIVETQGTPYFVKMVGPEATMTASRAAFDELVASVTPAQ